MRRTTRTAIALLCTLAMFVPSFSFAESTMETTENGSYIEFGSYPQTEIVSKEDVSGVYGKSWSTESDYTVDENLYNTLVNISEDQWSKNGDVTIDGNKYRRIKAGNATCNKTGEAGFYDWESTDTYHYFKYEPIKWRVLEQDGDDVFLLSETALDDQKYNSNITGDVTWESSTIRSWLNGYDSSKNAYGTDYSSNNFIDIAFTSLEQSKIKITDLENSDNNKSGTEGGNDTSDRIFLLSEDESYGSNATLYGFASSYAVDDTARQAKSSTYAKAMGAYSSDTGNCYWWLRSPGSHPGLFVLVRDSGNVFRGGQHANSNSRGVRPAMHISLSEEETIAETPVIQTVTVVTVDDEGKNIAESYTISGEEGTEYTINPYDISNYDTPSAVNGTFGHEETAVVTLVYTLNTDKSVLAAELIAQIEQGQYTDESYMVYSEAIAKGREVYNNNRAMQKEVDDAVISICQAKDALVLKENGYVQDTDGIDAGDEYVFVYGGYALGISNGAIISEAVSVSDGVLQAEDSFVWIVEKSTNGYTLKNKETGDYLTAGLSTSSRMRYILSLSDTPAEWNPSLKGTSIRLYTQVGSKKCYLSYSNGFTAAVKSSSSCNIAIYK